MTSIGLERGAVKVGSFQGASRGVSHSYYRSFLGTTKLTDWLSRILAELIAKKVQRILA